MRFGAVTDIGMHRKINEDNYYVQKNGLFPYAIVADGMGGHQAGGCKSDGCRYNKEPSGEKS